MARKRVQTNKGVFEIRYAYNGHHDKYGHCDTVVILDEANISPFEGEFGDEIYLVDEVIKKYEVKFAN